ARPAPLAPAGLEGYRGGELLSRMVADVDQLQDVALRLVLPVGVALLAGAGIVGGGRGGDATAGVLVGGGRGVAGWGCPAVPAPLVAARAVPRTQRRQAALRARLPAELVDALDAADEL